MSQLQVNTTPLFQTSLRSWQANWKASQGQARVEESGDSDRAAAVGMPSGHRLGRLVRRTRRPGFRADA